MNSGRPVIPPPAVSSHGRSPRRPGCAPHRQGDNTSHTGIRTRGDAACCLLPDQDTGIDQDRRELTSKPRPSLAHGGTRPLQGDTEDVWEFNGRRRPRRACG